MDIKNVFKKIVVKDSQNNVKGEVTDVVVIKSLDDSVLIEKGNSCIITGSNIDDTISFVSIDNNFTLVDQNTNSALINVVTTDNATDIVDNINTELLANNLSIKAYLLNANTNTASIIFYSTNNGSSSIELTGDITLISELGHSVGVTNGIDDNSISLSVNGSSVIGESSDGSYLDGAIGVYTSDILTPLTPIGHAVDWINEYLLKLTPQDNGVSLHNSDLSLSGIIFETGYISDDSTASEINYQAPYLASSLSARILTKSQISNLLKLITISFKNADKGFLRVELNNISLGSFDLETAFQESDRNSGQDVNAGLYASASTQELNFASIDVYDNFPLYQEAIAETLISNADTLLQNGYNSLKMIHTVGIDARETNDFEFYFNDTVDLPSVSVGSVIVAKGLNLTTRKMSGVNLINGGNDDITSPMFTNVSKYAYRTNPFSISGDIFTSTDIAYNDASLSGNSTPIDWQDIIGFTNKAVNIKSDLKYYDIPTTSVLSNNLVGSNTVDLVDTVKWVIDTYVSNNNSDTLENFNDENRRMYYGTTRLDNVNAVSGNDITCISIDFTGMVDLYVENLSDNTFAKITAVSGTTATLDNPIFAITDGIKVYTTGSLMLLSDKGNFNSNSTLIGRDYDYSASNDMTEAVALLGRTTRPSVNFSASHFPIGSPSYIPLDGRYATYVTYFKTSGVRTGMKLILEGLGSIVDFQNFIQEIRVTIPFDDISGVGTSGYNGTNFNPSNIISNSALYRGLLYKDGGTGQFNGSLGNPTEGSGIRLGEPILNGSDIEIDFTTGTLNNLLADYHYFVEIIIKNDAPIFSLTNSLLTGLRLEER